MRIKKIIVKNRPNSDIAKMGEYLALLKDKRGNTKAWAHGKSIEIAIGRLFHWNRDKLKIEILIIE